MNAKKILFWALFVPTFALAAVLNGMASILAHFNAAVNAFFEVCTCFEEWCFDYHSPFRTESFRQRVKNAYLEELE